MLRSALLNILGNALRYAKEKVLVKLVQTTTCVSIDISDDGPGISHDERKNIFTPYYRADASRSRETGGWGLGLAIVERVANLTKGQCSVDVSQFGGSCFSLTWRT